MNRHQIAALEELAEHHHSMGTHPIDVSGSDRQRHQRSIFHIDAATNIRLALAEIARHDPSARLRGKT